MDLAEDMVEVTMEEEVVGVDTLEIIEDTITMAEEGVAVAIEEGEGGMGIEVEEGVACKEVPREITMTIETTECHMVV